MKNNKFPNAGSVHQLRTTPIEEAYYIDQHVGQRIRLARISRKMSQKQLSEKLGISFQQLQKHESGANRIGAGRIMQAAGALNVPISFFYDGIKRFAADTDLAEQQFIDLSELSPVKSACIKTITRADDECISPVHELLKRITEL